MTDEAPWYRDGLHFTCTGCGNCCTGPPGVVWVDDEEIEQIAAYLGKSVGEVKLLDARLVGNGVSLREFANGDCIYFDGRTRKCTIYPVRPKQCRSWPFWRSNLASPQAWAETQRHCPGAGRGDFVSLGEIEALAALRDV